jgi:hypothetical protein
MPPRPSVEALASEDKAWLDRALVEGGFSGYEALAAELQARGYAISKSAVHRYGQAFEDRLAALKVDRLAALKVASEQARAVVTAAPDEEGAVNEALMRLVQEHLFKLLMAEGGEFDLPKVAKAVAELGKASVTQKRWQAQAREDERRRLLEEQAEALKGAQKDLGVSDQTLAAIRQTLGIV